MPSYPKPESQHREALLRDSLDSSSAPVSTSGPSMVQAPNNHLSRLVETDTPLPNTIMSGHVMRLESAGGVENQPERLPETVAEADGPTSSSRVTNIVRHLASGHLLAATPASTLSPAPAPALLGALPLQPVAGGAHPLSATPASRTTNPNLSAAHPHRHPHATTADAANISSSTLQSTSVDTLALNAGPGQSDLTPGPSPEPSCARSPSGAILQLGGVGPRTGPGAEPGPGLGDSGGSGSLGSFAPECRICLLSEPLSDLVAACHCTGSLTYAHMTCLKTWVMEKRSVRCELCGTLYKEPYGSELAASIPPAPPPQIATVRRLTTPDGQPIIIMPVGVDLGPGAMGPLLQHHPGLGMGMGIGVGGPHAHSHSGGPTVVGVTDPRELEPQPLCEWRNMWSYALILLLLLFAIIYVTVISKKGRQEPWMTTLWRVLLVVLPIYLVLRIAFDLYRHRLAQQLAAANLHAMAIANAAADAAAAAGHHHHHHVGTGGGPREVIITRAGNRLLVLQRAPGP